MCKSASRGCVFTLEVKVKKNVGLQLKGKDKQVPKGTEKIEIGSLLFLSLFVLVPTNVDRC